MELLLIALIVLAAVVFMRRGGPTWYRRGPRTVVRPELRRQVEEDAALYDAPTRRRRTIVEDF